MDPCDVNVDAAVVNERGDGYGCHSEKRWNLPTTCSSLDLNCTEVLEQLSGTSCSAVRTLGSVPQCPSLDLGSDNNLLTTLSLDRRLDLVLDLDCLDRRCLGTVDGTLCNSLGQTLAMPRMFLTLDPPEAVQTPDS